MKMPRRAKPSATDLLEKGNESFRAGRFYLAIEAFEQARQLDSRNSTLLFNLAGAKENIGEIDEAALRLTQALRHRPNWEEAAQRLALLIGRYRLETAADLDAHGLLAAFAFRRVDQNAIAAAALAHVLAQTALGEAVGEAAGGDDRALEAARALVLRRTDKALTQPLLLAALTASANHNPHIERLLTAIRRVLLLEVPAERFEDKALTAFTIALIRQCVLNEHVFAVRAEETAQLQDMTVDLAELLAGDTEQARLLMLNLLYQPPEDLVGKKLSIGECRSLRPRALGDYLAAWSQEEDRRTIIAADIPAIGALEDATSRRVARQYETHPYPRWTSLQMPAEASARAYLKRFFEADKLDFLDRTFSVLIAGCGTGQHAIAAAQRYGPQADVLAIDLSRASLAYALIRAEQFEIANLRFAQADILGPTGKEGPFDIIESIGVLHHMAEPFKGWQALVERLRPGGKMLTGLYSAVARSNIAELRSNAEYPGPDCDNATARAYRKTLMDRTDEAAAKLVHSHDFYTLSEFRDLVLHEQERPIVISEIEAFLAQHGLSFRGFQLPAPMQAAFQKTFPDDPWPGTLSNWAAFEEQHPRLFDGMYRFWCEKTA